VRAELLNVRYWTKADKVAFWLWVVCPLMTQSGHSGWNLGKQAIPPDLGGHGPVHDEKARANLEVAPRKDQQHDYRHN